MGSEAPPIRSTAEGQPGYVCGVGRVVTTQVRLLSASGRVSSVHPAQPGLKPPKHEWWLPSLPLPWRPKYRVAVPRSLDRIFAGYLVHRPLLVWLDTIAKPDIVHLHGYHPVNEYLYVAARRCDVPVVYQLHTDEWQYAAISLAASRWGAKRLIPLSQRLISARQRWIAEHSDAILCPSRHATRIFCEHTGLPIERVTVLPSIVEPFELWDEGRRQKEEQRWRHEWNIAVNPKLSPILLSVGRLAPEKNTDFLLQMMAALVEQKGNKQVFPYLVLVGDGPADYRRYLEQLIGTLKLGSCVRMPGEVPPDIAMRLPQIAALCLHSSESETDGLVGKECDLCGTPRLSMAGTAMAESNPTPELILPDNPSHWAAATLDMLAHPARLPAIGAASRQYALERSSPALYIERLTGIYRSAWEHLIQSSRSGD